MKTSSTNINLKSSSKKNNLNKSIPNICKILEETQKHISLRNVRGLRGVVILKFVKAACMVTGNLGYGHYFEYDSKENRWSAPISVVMVGCGFGLSFGATSNETVILIRDENINLFKSHGQIRFGFNEDAALGTGIEESKYVASNLRSITSYDVVSKSLGLMAGISFDGSTLAINSIKNRIYYRSHKASFDNIISEKVTCPNLEKARWQARVHHYLENMRNNKPVQHDFEKLGKTLRSLEREYSPIPFDEFDDMKYYSNLAPVSAAA